MYIKRLDKGCESRILGTYDGKVLLEARWPVGAKNQQRNVVEISQEYFERKYGAR